MPTLSGLLGSTFIGLQGTQGTQGLQGVQGSILSNVPQNSKSAQYTLQISDIGKHVSTTYAPGIGTASIIVPISVFSPGDTVTIFNNTSSDITISKQSSSVTMYLAGTSTDTTNRTLSQRGLCTLLCITGGSTPTFVIAGSGLT